MRKLEKFAMPNLRVHELDQPVSEIVKKDFAVMPKDSTLADVLKKFRETKCEIIIVQDKNNRVIGTLSPSEFLSSLKG